ncbi:hypothetical protein RO3G_07996 [Rhizopus delemar RA 99-880]|uniref:Uncharacterized protein n=1 Tax=Rhizopus delemar (strain RA 99-880 / ATCC MYA-4621 / FGSC 9543 / NRRL 43880) TaxID=246409 RepID=I1C4B1_RHIO9|nr:hypothetical protein RO3G_07996 [Rhizopus delemar RA 99-880]|eukprot:EIE83291.1 hypothetical protein RO3G_07996 [Rhizopus delemar RA 99-880]
MFDLSIPEPSEENLNIKIWGRVIESLFSNSPIECLSGVTVSRELKTEFRVDCRLGIMINSSFVDLTNVEVGKWSNHAKIKNYLL